VGRGGKERGGDKMWIIMVARAPPFPPPPLTTQTCSSQETRVGHPVFPLRLQNVAKEKWRKNRNDRRMIATRNEAFGEKPPLLNF